MGYAVPSLSSNMLRNQKTDIEYRLMEIVQKMQLSTRKTSEISEKYSKNITNVLQDTDEDLMYIGELSETYLEYKPELDRIHAEEKKLEAEKLNLETKLKEIDTLLESYNKLIDNGIKNSVMKSGS